MSACKVKTELSVINNKKLPTISIPVHKGESVSGIMCLSFKTL